MLKIRPNSNWFDYNLFNQIALLEEAEDFFSKCPDSDCAQLILNCYFILMAKGEITYRQYEQIVQVAKSHSYIN